MKQRGLWRHACACCNGAAVGEGEGLRLLQLLALIEDRDALPPALAVRLGTELLAHAADGSVFRCEAFGEIER